MRNMLYSLFFLMTYSLFNHSCGVNGSSTKKSESNKESVTTKSEPTVKQYDIDVSCTAPSNVKQGEEVVISYKVNLEVDSILLFIGKDRYAELPTDNKWRIKTTDTDKVGTKNYRVTAFKDNYQTSYIGKFTVEPAAAPKKYVVKIVKTYEHSRNAYTQGLEFYNGNLYESSGEYGISYVRSLEFPSMREKKKEQIDPNYFAEGITFLNDQLYMLTWQENTCYVMDPKDFKIVKKFSYNTEGWGITTDGEKLYMSDGSHFIYIMDPATFTVLDKLEVMAGAKKMESINEMEWINGEIWANVYLTDTILRISPKTGAVLGVIDASNLLKAKDMRHDTDVLNGIAYDRQKDKIYITGKKWPKLFEVKIENK